MRLEATPRWALLACCLPALTFAQAPECQPGQLVGQRAGSVGTLVVCAVPLQRDPAFLALVERLNTLLRNNDATADAVRRLAPSLNGAARGLSPAQVGVLAGSLSQRLEPALQQGNERVLREVDALRAGFDGLRDTVERLARNGSGDRAVQLAMAGDAGDALAHLDFGSAADIVQRLARIEQKIDQATNPPQSGAMLPLETEQAEQQWQRFVELGGARRCPKVHAQLEQLRADAARAAADRQFESARRMQLAIRTASLGAAQYLLNEEAQRLREQQSWIRGRETAQDLLADLQDRSTRADADLARAKGKSVERRAEIAEHLRAAVAHLEAARGRAEALAAAGDEGGATALLHDAMRDARRLREGRPLQTATEKPQARHPIVTCY